MKLLLDACVWGKSREELAAAGHGAVVLERYGTMLARGAMVTVEPGRVRVRPPEGEDEFA